MKWLDAQRIAAAQAKGEHKMMPGIREDQRPDRSVIISPAVAQLAAELGVDLSTVTGTGRDGIITKKDVRARKAQLDEEQLAQDQESAGSDA